jgi:hypothetical protein
VTEDFEYDKRHQYQTISFQEPYQSSSLEELRLADYHQGRRYGHVFWQRLALGQSVAFAGPNKDTKSESEHDSGSQKHSDSKHLMEDEDYSEQEDHSEQKDHSEQEDHSEPEHDSELDHDSEPECDSSSEEHSNSDDLSEFGSYNILDGTAPIKAVMRALISRPISGERRIDKSTLRNVTSDLSFWDRIQIEELIRNFNNPDGSCRVPLDSVIRLLKKR